MFDKKKIEEGIRLLLEGIGENPDREGLKDTPDRVARMYEELCSGMNMSPKEHLSKTFTCDNENVVIEPQFFGAKEFNEKGSCFVLTGDKWQLLKLYRLNREE